MNVSDLMEILAGADPDAPVLVSGYEGGYTHVSSASVCPMQELDRGDAAAWLGEFASPAVAAAEASPDPNAPFAEMCGPPPTLVGDPVTALVISRCGR